VGINLTEYNCFELTGNSYHDIIGLTGVYGLFSLENVRNAINAKISDAHDIIEINIVVDGIKIIRKIHLKAQYLENVLLKAKEHRGQGIGFEMLKSQIEYGRKMEFKRIELLAWGAIDEEFNGYLTWAKYGFTMMANSSRWFRETLIPELKRIGAIYKDYSNVHELLDDIEISGEEVWAVFGEAWYGVFLLSKKSYNTKRLQSYDYMKKVKKAFSSAIS